MCEAVTGADDKVLKSVIRVEFGSCLDLPDGVSGFICPLHLKIDGDEMSGNLLCGPCKASFAVIAEETDSWLIRASDTE